MTQKRLLVVSPRFLFPLDQGGRIRTANTLRHLKGGAFHITLVSPAPPDAARWDAEMAGLCDAFETWAEPHASLPAKILALAGRLPVAVASDASDAGRAVVARALAAGPDAVLVDFPHAAVLMPDAIAAPTILFTHNVEAEIFARQVQVAPFPMRLVWQHETRKMRRFEGEVVRQYGTIIAVSVRDARALEATYGVPEVHPVETGVDTGYYGYRPAVGAVPEGGGTMVFTGAMDSRSNIEGIGFLMNEVWPRVLQRRPAARALIVGRNPPESLAAAAKARGFDWRFTGFVDDVRPFVAKAHAYAIPLRVGSGTRIKVFEAMAMGCPVVSTGLGVEGLDVTPGTHYLRADDAAGFAAALLVLLGDGGRREALAGAARDLVETRFSWPAVTRRFEEICLLAAGS